MPSLNNELDIITVGGVDQDIRDTTTRNSIGPTEPLNVASANYRENEIFYSGADRTLYRAIDAISIGDTFTTGTNVERTTLSELMYRLFVQSAEKVMRAVANYEPTNVASKTYYKGNSVFLGDGRLYKVTAKTYSGTPLTEGTNVELSDTLMDSIDYLYTRKENKKVVLEQRLTGGDTTVQFTDDAIDSTKILTPATDSFGKMPISMTQDEHTVTMVFKAQNESMTVYLIIEEGI